MKPTKWTPLCNDDLQELAEELGYEVIEQGFIRADGFLIIKARKTFLNPLPYWFLYDGLNNYIAMTISRSAKSNIFPQTWVNATIRKYQSTNK